jgi:hypothetical protein
MHDADYVRYNRFVVTDKLGAQPVVGDAACLRRADEYDLRQRSGEPVEYADLIALAEFALSDGL